MHNDYATAISYAETLYGSAQYATQLISAVVGDSANIDIISLSHDFLDVLIEEVGCPIIIRYLNISEWKSYVSKKAVSPIIKQLEEAVAKAMSTRKNGPIARWNAGNELMATAKQLLLQLRKLLPKSDLQYQVIADKVGIEILQCGIDYFNDSEEFDAADKAMSLQKYAKSIAVGQMAKDRCKENVDILQRIIDNLPPSEVFVEDRAIHEELRKYCLLPDNIIAEVNEAQSIFSADKDDPNATLAAILGITHVKSVLEEAWKATRIMDGFDMEADYKSGRYSENRSILKGLCEQMGVSTSTYTPSSSSSQPTHRNTSSTARPYSSASNRATVNRQTTSTNCSSSSSNDGPPWGCFIVIAIYIIIFLISICS